ncbi:hypothetical protein [Desulfolithobacter sp.]
MRRWVYRTILFEFQKDRLLGDKYINDEEVEKTLNEQGALGWELVGVTTTQEGLLAICKRPDGSEACEDRPPVTVSETGSDDAVEEEEVVSARALQEQERAHIMELEARRRQAMQEREEEQEQDLVGKIRIF